MFPSVVFYFLDVPPDILEVGTLSDTKFEVRY